jgi:DNA-binding IclR family transcriptional regulator
MTVWAGQPARAWEKAVAGSDDAKSSRSVVSKVLSLLDAFSPAAAELTLNELSRRTGLPLSTTYRLASELVAWGGLERVQGGGYRVGLRLWEIGSLAPRGADLRAIALPFMQDLHEATREHVHLAVLDGREALYLETITGRRGPSLKSRRGGRVPLHATGVGKVLLAYTAAAFVEDVIAAGLERYTPHTITAPGLLRRALAEVRRTGVGYAREELTIGSVAVASPLLDAEGAAVAALSIVAGSARADLRRLAPAVRTAALCASRRMRGETRADEEMGPDPLVTGGYVPP